MLLAQIAGDLVTAPEAGAVANQGANFWILLLGIIGTLVPSVGTWIIAQALKVRAEATHIEMVRDRELARQQADVILKAAEIAKDKAQANTEKLEVIGKQTDGRFSEMIEANKLLQARFDAMVKELSTLQGRELERKAPEAPVATTVATPDAETPPSLIELPK